MFGFHPEELGIKDVRILYDWMDKMRKPGDPELFVLESDDLVNNPEAIMDALCKQYVP